MIISGVNDNGQEVTNKQIIKEINSLYQELQPEDHARLIMIYLACYEIPDKDAQSLMSTLGHGHQEA